MWSGVLLFSLIDVEQETGYCSSQTGVEPLAHVFVYDKFRTLI